MAECGREHVLDGKDKYSLLSVKIITLERINLPCNIDRPKRALCSPYNLITTRPSGTLTNFDCPGSTSIISRHFEILACTNERIALYYRKFRNALKNQRRHTIFLDYLSSNPCVREIIT